MPWSRESRAKPLIPLWAVRPLHSLSTCKIVHYNFTYNSTPPIDRMACTEPQCLYKGAVYLYLYLYSPYGPYSLYRTSVSKQLCTVTLPIPLLPLWTVQPVQSLCAGERCTLPLHIRLIPLWTVRPKRSLSASTKLHFTLPITPIPLWAVRSVHSLSTCTMMKSNFTYTSFPI